MSTVSSSTLLWCLVDLDVLDNKVTGIETLGVCVCLRVLEETEKELGRLDWPSSTGNTELLSCSQTLTSCSRHLVSTRRTVSYRNVGNGYAHLELHVQFLQRIFSLGQPPCVVERSPRTGLRAGVSILG